MNVLRKDASNGKKTCDWPYAETLSGGSGQRAARPYVGTKPPISNGNPKSEFWIWACSQTVNDFESKGL